MFRNTLCLARGTALIRQRLQPNECFRRMLATRYAKDVENEGSSGFQAAEPIKKYVNPFAAQSVNLELDEANTPVESLSEEEKEKRLKVLQLEADIACQEGRRVPTLDFFQDHHWQQVLSLPTKSARMKYYGYLWQIENKKQTKERRKEEKAVATAARLEQLREEREQNDHIIYGLGHVSMFLRVYDSTINHWMNHRLIRAMLYSPKIVLDCSYDNYMVRREAQNAAKQLMLCFAENRLHDDPFDLHYCNVDLNSTCMQSLQRYIPTMLNPEFPMNVHKQCFTEIFPKENIVYLTPHCRTDLKEYNHDDIYVIGAMVDTVNNEPLSLAKAKKLGLRMARLPLDQYLQWGAGSGKSLTLNQMINIMLDIRKTGDWNYSLRHVPRRKIIDMKREAEYTRRQSEQRTNRYNVRMDRIMSDEDDEIRPKNQMGQFRSHKKDLQFNLATWGSGKKKSSPS